MDKLTILKGTRELLSVESRWTQKLYARRADGSGASVTSPFASCWCLVGAADKVALDLKGYVGLLDDVLDSLRAEIGVGESLTRFNDSHSHAEVLALLDRAIAKVEASC